MRLKRIVVRERLDGEREPRFRESGEVRSRKWFMDENDRLGASREVDEVEYLVDGPFEVGRRHRWAGFLSRVRSVGRR